MTAATPELEDLIANLLAAARVRTRAPATSGLYAWWAHPSVLPELAGPAHPVLPGLRLLYIGIASKLRSRLASNHLRRSGSSTLCRLPA